MGRRGERRELIQGSGEGGGWMCGMRMGETMLETNPFQKMTFDLDYLWGAMKMMGVW
jgi:hypothetical protein